MAMGDKDRDDGYWRVFAETRQLPVVSSEEVMSLGEERVMSILKGQYNQLTKVLFAERLGGIKGFADEIAKAQAEAAAWIRPMIYSKKRMYAHKGEMDGSFVAFMKTSGNLQLQKLANDVEAERQIRDWPMRAKALFAAGPANLEAGCAALMHDLSTSADIYRKVAENHAFRNIVLVWTAVFLDKLRRRDLGVPRDLGAQFIKVLYMDGLADVPAECWERKKMDVKPEKGKDYFPSTIEKLAQGLYSLLIDRYGRTEARTEAANRIIDWGTDVLKTVYGRIDDEWGCFRIGKLMLLRGRVEEAKALLMPVIRRMSSQFWAWDMLGLLFPERRAACLAQALLCPAEAVMLSRVRKEAAALGLPIADPHGLKIAAADVRELLYEGFPEEDAVLESCYVNKEGKDRIRFVVKTGRDMRPVPPRQVRLPKNAKPGDPFTVVTDPEDLTRIVAVKPRDGSRWDVLPRALVVCSGRSRKGNVLLASGTVELSCRPGRFEILDAACVGDVFEVYYTTRQMDFGVIHEIREAMPSSAAIEDLTSYEGPIRFPQGIGASAFVGDVYVPVELVGQCLGQGLKEGDVVAGRALRLPPRQERDRHGVIRLRCRVNALTIVVLKGQNLERYRSQRF